MAQRNQIAIKVALRQNRNTKSAAYGKYYAEVQNNETLSTRGLLEHIMSHGLGYPRSIVQGVLAQLAECLTELILQGQPVKLDGFGTFKLEVKTAEGVGGWTASEVVPGMDLRSKIAGLRLVVIPDGTELDKLTSTANLERASLENLGVMTWLPSGKVDSEGNELTTKAYMPLSTFAAENAPNP